MRQLFSVTARWLLAALILCPLAGYTESASDSQFDALTAAGYVARVELNDPAAVNAALKRAEAIYNRDPEADDLPPLVFILHGPEVAVFFKRNYRQHRELVDRAARLSAFGVIDIRVCGKRLRKLKGESELLHSFVEIVAFGPDELRRLRRKLHYQYF